jgi:ribosomal protein S18 acetylase RimI-like enzyme
VPETTIIVRPLAPEDAPAYVSIRRAMLADTPRAFSADPDTDRGSDEAGVRQCLARPDYAIAGAFAGNRLVSAAGLSRTPGRKLMHRVFIWGVWTHPDFRGRGLGERVMRHAIVLARSWPGIRAVCLSACREQHAAVRLYERLGFKTWGIEPDMMHVDGRFYEEVHMQLRL